MTPLFSQIQVTINFPFLSFSVNHIINIIDFTQKFILIYSLGYIFL
jgi:hypothetical protein